MLPLLIICVALGCRITGSQACGVVNGSDTYPGQIPFLVSVREGLNHICSGTILDGYRVLTAAHCVLNKTQNISIEAGTIQLQHETGVVMPVDEIFIHPDYAPLKSRAHDLAILWLGLPLIFSFNIMPINLPERWIDSPEGSAVFLFGWGITPGDTGGLILINGYQVGVVKQKVCVNEKRTSILVNINHDLDWIRTRTAHSSSE